MERIELKNGFRGKRTLLKYIFRCIVHLGNYNRYSLKYQLFFIIALLLSISTDVCTVLNLLPAGEAFLPTAQLDWERVA